MNLRTGRRHAAVLTTVALLTAACGADDGTGVRNIGADGSGSGSASGSASGSSASGSASGSGPASGDTSGAEASGAIGRYEPVSDVSAHALVTADVCDIDALLPSEGEIDYAGIAEVYAEGGNSPDGDGFRTLAGFATAERDEPLWNRYVERLGDAWLDDHVTAAIEGSGVFEGESDAVRRQAIQKGVQNQILVAWAFHEADAGAAALADGDTDPASGAPHKVDEIWAFYHGSEPDCAPFATASKRGEDFGTGEAANDAALAATEAMRDAAVAGDVDAYDAASQEFVDAVVLTYVQASVKYAKVMSADLEAGDAEAARTHQAEGWAFFRVIEPLVADVDADAADTVAGVFDLANEPTADAGETVTSALEGVYEELGLTADEVGTYTP